MSLLLALASTQTFAWTVLENQDGAELRWVEMPITFAVNAGNALGLSAGDVTLALNGAHKAWEGVGTATIDFEDQGHTTVATVDYDQVNAIYFDAGWTLDSELMAITANWSYSDGTVVGFDIRINDRDHEWVTNGRGDADDLQNMLTHELGHCLGLDHTTVDEEATMYAAAISGEQVKRVPKADDQAGVQYLYGNGSPVDVSESDTAACSSLDRTPASWAGLLLMGLMIGRRRSDPRCD